MLLCNCKTAPSRVAVLKLRLDDASIKSLHNCLREKMLGISGGATGGLDGLAPSTSCQDQSSKSSKFNEKMLEMG